MAQITIAVLYLFILFTLLTGCVPVSKLSVPTLQTATEFGVVVPPVEGSPIPPEPYPGPRYPTAADSNPAPAEDYPAPITRTAVVPTEVPRKIVAEQEFDDPLEAGQAADFSILAPGEAPAGLDFWKAATRVYEDSVTVVILYYANLSETANPQKRQVQITQAPVRGGIPTGFSSMWFGAHARARVPVRRGEGELFGPSKTQRDQETSLVWREGPLWLKVTLSGDWAQPGVLNSVDVDDLLIRIAESLVPAEIADWQVYTDPAGQFSVRLPETWQPGNEAGTFQGPDGFFKTTYLPEMTNMGRVHRVCEKLANTSTGSLLQVGGGPSFNYSPYRHINMCTVTPGQPSSTDLVQVVVMNPLGDPSQRFFMLEADADHYQEIAGSLLLKNPPSDPYETVQLSGPLRPEDKTFWQGSAALPQGIIIEEYAIDESPESSLSTHNFDYELLEQARQKRRAWREETGDWRTERLIENNEQLMPFGYSIRHTGDSDLECYGLFREDNLILDQIEIFWPVSMSASGNNFGMVMQLENGSYQLLQKDGLHDWQMFPTYLPPVFHESDLMTVRVDTTRNLYGGRYQLWKGQEQVFEFAAIDNIPPVKGIWSWQGHWLMEFDGFLIQDGENLNEQLGLEEIFGWHLLDGKPVYFFRKGPRVGISFDGQRLPVYYEDIKHYLCCEMGMYNPGWNERMLWFYGFRDGVWYYVEIGKYEG